MFHSCRGLDLRNESDAPQQAEVHASADIAALRDTAASEGEPESKLLQDGTVERIIPFNEQEVLRSSSQTKNLEESSNSSKRT